MQPLLKLFTGETTTLDVEREDTTDRVTSKIQANIGTEQSLEWEIQASLVLDEKARLSPGDANRTLIASRPGIVGRRHNPATANPHSRR